jgi:transcriptional regulator with XRE-family HTH domain
MQDENKKNFTTLGRRIQHLREELQLNQTVFAEQLGFATPAVISRFERDERQPDIETLLKIADLWKVNLHYLLTGEPSPDAERWKESYVELTRTLGTYIALDTDKTSQERAALMMELCDCQAKAGKGEGVQPDRIKYLKYKIEELDKHLRENDDAHHKAIERYYGKNSIKIIRVANSVPETPKNNPTTTAALK